MFVLLLFDFHLLVCFVIVCLLLVLLVSVQDDGENGMGGLMGGRGIAAFGSHSASVLTKTTMVFVILFLVFGFCCFILIFYVKLFVRNFD